MEEAADYNSAEFQGVSHFKDGALSRKGGSENRQSD